MADDSSQAAAPAHLVHEILSLLTSHFHIFYLRVLDGYAELTKSSQ